MYKISARLLSGKNDGQSTPICQGADTPEDVIKFVDTLNASNLMCLEVSEYDEGLVECLSYADFLSAHEQQKLNELFSQFDQLMNEFHDMADEVIVSLAMITDEAQSRIEKSTERAIAAIEKINIESILSKTNSDDK